MNLYNISIEQQELLKTLDDTIGMTAFAVAETSAIYYGHPIKAASQYAAKGLVSMEGYGLCRRMDARRPVLWLRTEQGTAYLESNLQ